MVDMQKDEYRNHKMDKKLINMLQGMPKIADKKEREQLYQEVSMKLRNSDQSLVSKKQKKKYLPVFATTIVAVSMILISLITLQYNHSDSEQIEMQEDSISEMDIYQMEEANGSNAIGQESSYSDLVVYSNDDNNQIVYGAVPDEQHQYMIPITFIVSNKKSINEHYNQLEKYLQQHPSLSETEYLFEDVDFTIDEEQHKVNVQLPDDFTLGNSSAQAYELEKMLSMMFSPVGIKKAVFETQNNEGVNLGPYGKIKELALTEEKASYKLYQEQFLVPIPNDEQTSIHDAIREMKHGDNSFDIKETIPNDIHFQVSSEQNKLILQYDHQEQLEDTVENERMIAAILMTAKSYGYESVHFTNMEVEKIGIYDFNKAIEVPEGVNPVDIEK